MSHSVTFWEKRRMGTRLETNELILEAAESLFLERGLLDVSMEEIALRASCTRRNLYRYFETKETLSLAVLRKLLAPWNDFQTETFRSLSASGLSGRQELEAFLRILAGYLEEQKSLLRFAAEYDFLFRDRLSLPLDPSAEESLFADFHVTEDLLSQILVRGEKDGSLRLPTPPETLVPTITTVFWSLGQRVALRENLIALEFGVKAMELVNAQIQLLVLALSAEPKTK